MARHGIFMLNFRIFALFLADVYAFQSAKLDKDMPGTCECVLYFGEVEPSKIRPKLHSKQGSVGFLVSGADGQIIATPNGRVVVDPHLVEWPWNQANLGWWNIMTWADVYLAIPWLSS